MFKNKSIFTLFLLESLALVVFVWHQFIFESNIIKFQSLSVYFVSFLALAIFMSMFFYKVLNFYNNFLASITQEDPLKIGRSLTISLSPFLLLYLIFIQDVIFLRDFRLALLIISFIGASYIHSLFLAQLKKLHPQKLLKSKIWGLFKLKGLSRRQTSVFVFVASLSIYCLFASGFIFSPYPLTGDEPHYLIIAKSLLSDGDLNLWNNYQNKDYLEFYPGELDSHTRTGKKGVHYQYSRHMPALSLMLLPSYYMGEKIGAFISYLTKDPLLKRETLVFMIRLVICILAASLCWALFSLVYYFAKNRELSLLVWLIFGFTSPLLFYSHLIYPEIPASLIIILILLCLIKKRDLTLLNCTLIGAGIAFLPWFGMKYSVLAIGIFFIFISYFLKSKKKNLIRITFSFVPLLLSFLFIFFYIWSLHGEFSPLSIYESPSSEKSYMLSKFFHFNLIEFFRSGLGYLFDQRVGIFPYSPVYILFVPGIFLMIKKFKKETLYLMFLLLIYWSFCSLGYYWGGYCPPGRTLLPVLWVMALLAGGALVWNQNQKTKLIVRISVFLSFAVALALANNTALLYHENLSFFPSEKGKFSNLLTSLSNSFVDFRKIVPSYSNKENILLVPLIIWIIGVAFISLFILKKKKIKIHKEFIIPLRTHLIIIFSLSLCLLAYIFFDIHLDNGYLFRNKDYVLFFQDENHHGKEREGFWTKGKSKTEVLIKTFKPVSDIDVSVSSAVKGRTIIQVGKSEKEVIRHKGADLGQVVHFHSMLGFPWKSGSYLYSIKIKESNGFIPYRLDKASVDQRFLGVFVKIAVR